MNQSQSSASPNIPPQALTAVPATVMMELLLERRPDIRESFFNLAELFMTGHPFVAATMDDAPKDVVLAFMGGILWARAQATAEPAERPT